jgi:hypothetical protein
VDGRDKPGHDSRELDCFAVARNDEERGPRRP